MAERVFVISPSYQSDWHLSVKFLALLGVILFIICTYFINLGLWLILPFAGLEFVTVSVALWMSAEQSNQKNVVKITEESVTLEKGRRTRTSSITLEKIWCEVLLEYLPRRWKHSQLFLRCKDNKIEFAEFLDCDEQKALCRELKSVIGPVGV